MQCTASCSALTLLSCRLQAAINPRNTVHDIKRLIGRKFQDPLVQSDMKHWAFNVVPGPDNKPMVEGESCA